MEIKEDYCYRSAKNFTENGIEFKAGDEIVTFRVTKETAYFCKKNSEEDCGVLPEYKLAQLLDLSSGVEDFGTCENCGCELSYLPEAGWGVGYVCGSCAQKLRGELEY